MQKIILEVKMKSLKYCLLLTLCIISLMLCGCKDKSLPQPMIERDIYNTGGSLTFVYDRDSHTATFGGDGEVIQYYKQDITKGWNKEGNRIGLQILLPKVNEYRSGQAKLDGKKLLPNEYVVSNDGKSQVAQFYLLVEEGRDVYNLEVTWEDGKDLQYYIIRIKDGTLFMKEEDLTK